MPDGRIPLARNQEVVMEQFIANAIAQTRRDEFAREAANSRLVGQVRRNRRRDPRAEPRPAPRHREVRRTVTA
jgi:hypothetical protein